jgi:hypothetical protein
MRDYETNRIAVGIAALAALLGGCVESHDPPVEPVAPFWEPNLDELPSCGGPGAPSHVQSPALRAMIEGGCERLLSDISVEFDFTVSDLGVLAPLRRIDGHLHTFSNPITTLEGLERLESVGGNLQLRNLQIVDTRELGRLRLVEADLRIDNNTRLVGLAGLESLERVGRLAIGSNPELESLDGLSGLRRVDGDLRIANNPKLSDEEVAAFVSRIDVGGEVVIGVPPVDP